MKNKYEIRGDVIAIFIRWKGTTIETLIDAEDLEKVIMNHKTTWSARQDDKNLSKYVLCTKQVNLKRRYIHLHRLVVNCPDGYVVDHINGNTLDNRKSNLRLCTSQENQQNRNRSKSEIRGVHFHAREKKWYARVGLNGGRITIGTYDTKEEAIHAVKVARAKLHPLSSEANNENYSTQELKFNKRLKRIAIQSGVKGITWRSGYDVWEVRMSLNGQRHFLGWFKDLEGAKKELEKFKQQKSVIEKR
jgi:hypothetical protein